MSLANPASTEIPEPDFTLYGTPVVAGSVLSAGTLTLTVNDEPAPIASYTMGSDQALAELYALRLPMDLGEPRRPATARPGDQAKIWIDGEIAARFTIGEPGRTVRFDFDSDLVDRVSQISVVDAKGAEQDAGSNGFDVAVRILLASASEDEITVDWSTVDGTAVAGADYRAGAGQLVFAAGQTAADVSVRIWDDALAEADPASRNLGEHFFVELTNPTRAGVLDARGRVTIIDDDTPPALAINDLTVVEPVVGRTVAQVSVRASHAWTSDVQFDFSAVEGTAGANDFVLAPGSGTIVAGELSTSIAIDILSDQLVEEAEQLSILLSNPSGASLLDAAATATILEDARVLSFVETHKDGQLGVDGLGGPTAVAAAPDGAHVYTTSRGDGAVVVWARDVMLGNLEPAETYQDGVSGITALGGARDIAVSPDGAWVVVSALDEDALSVFRRDQTTGSLTLIEVERHQVQDRETGVVLVGLDAPSVLVFDPLTDAPLLPGGRTLYAAGSRDGTLSVFDQDPLTGALSHVQTLEDSGQGLGEVTGIVVAPNGEQVYVVSRQDDSVSVFDRDPTTGRLTFSQMHSDGGAGVDGLADAAAVAISPDGAQLFVAGERDGALAVFDRNPVDGLLTYRASVDDGAGQLALVADVEVSRDGRYVYAAGFSQDALVVFERRADGDLEFIEAERDGEAGVSGLAGLSRLGVTSDDAHVFGIGHLADAMATFRRDVTAPAGPSELMSTSHEISVFSNLPQIDVRWSGASDNALGSTVAGYWVGFDETPDTIPVLGPPSLFVPHGADPHLASSDLLTSDSAGIFAHVRTCDFSGNCDEARHSGPYPIDITPPEAVSNLTSTSHSKGEPSNDATVEVSWVTAADFSGISGYASAFDPSPVWVCDEVSDLPGGAQGAVSTPLGDGDWFFHVCARDLVGFWGPVATAGPFSLDLTAPPAVIDLSSPSHPLDAPATDTTIDVVWTDVADAGSGIEGYAVHFSSLETWECDGIVDALPGVSAFSSSPLADADWYAHICARDRAGNLSAVETSGPHAIASDMPKVTNVSSVAATADAVLADGEQTVLPITQLVLEFDRALRNPAGDDQPGDASNAASYQLIASGADGSFETASCAAGVAPTDSEIVVTRVTLNGTDDIATLRVGGGMALPTGQYRLFGCGDALASVGGTPLDGNGDGVGTDDFQSDFRVLVTNLLADPNVDDDLAAWQISHPPSGSVEWSANDTQGLPSSGSARLSDDGGAAGEQLSVGQCVILVPGVEEMQFTGRIRLNSAVPAGAEATPGIEFFRTTDCDRSVGGVSGASIAPAADIWQNFVVLLQPDAVPLAARSLLLKLDVVPADGAAFEALVDLMTLADYLALFRDGFENGHAGAWSSAVP